MVSQEADTKFKPAHCDTAAPSSQKGGHTEIMKTLQATVSAERTYLKLDVTSLPHDLLVQVIGYLHAWDVVGSRRVSKSWNSAFSDVYALHHKLRQDFKHTREVKELIEKDAFDTYGSTRETYRPFCRLFQRLACRYYHLCRATPRSVLKFRQMQAATHISSHTEKTEGSFYPIEPWMSHDSWPQNNPGAIPLYSHAFWTYDDGLLVYPAHSRHNLVLVDLESETELAIPFPFEDRVIRNFRLKCRVLVIEWAESRSTGGLNETEPVYRHVASVYHLSKDASSLQNCWLCILHTEFKLFFCGLTLNNLDLFFSTHTAQHYAVYFHRPNRSMYTADEDEPIESLRIWDISRPSVDPTGSFEAPHSEPIVLAPHELSFYNVRQRGRPGLMTLTIDSECGTLAFRCRRNSPIHHPTYADPPDFPFRTSTTTIPFKSFGPHNHICYDSTIAPSLYIGTCTMDSSSETLKLEARPGYDILFNVVDQDAEVQYTFAQRTFPSTVVMRWTSVEVLVGKPSEQEYIPELDDEYKKMVTAKGKMAGDERWLIGEGVDGYINVLRFDR